MGARRLDSGHILAAMPASDGDTDSDGVAELAPGDAGYAEFDAWLKVYADAGEPAPADDVPAVWPVE